VGINLIHCADGVAQDQSPQPNREHCQQQRKAGGTNQRSDDQLSER
jgi:hypothetical protein